MMEKIMKQDKTIVTKKLPKPILDNNKLSPLIEVTDDIQGFLDKSSDFLIDDLDWSADSFENILKKLQKKPVKVSKQQKDRDM